MDVNVVVICIRFGKRRHNECLLAKENIVLAIHFKQKGFVLKKIIILYMYMISNKYTYICIHTRNFEEQYLFKEVKWLRVGIGNLSLNMEIKKLHLKNGEFVIDIFNDFLVLLNYFCLLTEK